MAHARHTCVCWRATAPASGAATCGGPRQRHSAHAPFATDTCTPTDILGESYGHPPALVCACPARSLNGRVGDDMVPAAPRAPAGGVLGTTANGHQVNKTQRQAVDTLTYIYPLRWGVGAGGSRRAHGSLRVTNESRDRPGNVWQVLLGRGICGRCCWQ